MIKKILNFLKVSNDEDNANNGKNIYRNSKNKIQSRNIMAKFLAILLATGLWFYVMNEQNPPTEVKRTVPLEVKNLASNYVVVDIPREIKKI